MERLTKKTNDVYYALCDDLKSDGKIYIGKVIDKLAKFENFYEGLIQKYSEIEREMEKLRAEGKTSTVKFKQLLANKLEINNIITILKYNGLQ
ncbi:MULTISPECIES: hypothetical protein [Sedimentibacter]|uniref:hypothetical protein n=1 Tax=Sedimentibacter sp. B4 TaxID=304766 RepID=UPI0002FF79C9|nr:hypothetical protein [Sedimentibacter sp. B4]